jgi:hypothetical protein
LVGWPTARTDFRDNVATSHSQQAGSTDEAIALIEATVDDRELVLGTEYRCRATFLR